MNQHPTVTVSRLIPHMTEKMAARFRALPFLPQSAIIKAVPYFTGDTDGNIAAFARPRDYHAVVYKLTQNYEHELSAQYPNMKFLALKNGWPLPIVAAANMCGLGFTGRHGMQIVEPYGSYVALSAVLCDTLLPETSPSDTCRACGACERACPTGAMRFDGEKRVLNRERCIASITQNPDTDISLLKLSPYIWGCDICQKVCPHNQQVKTTDIPEFYERIIPNIDATALDGDLSDRHYASRLDLIKRNLEVIK